MRRYLTLGGLGGLLLAGLSFVSLFVGSGDVPAAEVWQVLTHPDHVSAAAKIVWDLRLGRIPVALITGAALGVAGALAQTLTRNPLADPGILGVNSGAALAVALGMLASTTLSSTTIVALAMSGAAVAGVGVLLIGGVLQGRRETVRLVLSGAALSAVTSAFTGWIILTNPAAFTTFRAWESGAVSSRPTDLVLIGLVVCLIAVIALAPMVRGIDALVLGHDMAGALGVNSRRTWIITGLCAVALCGAATALTGPVAFLGLVAPLGVRWVTGPRTAPLLVGSALLGATALLAADCLGRVLVPPREVAAAIVCGLIGAPAFVMVARRLKVVTL